ncbi:hypothetical protein QCA50_001584 [Cerrena zonata]|uniref:Cilia- and flagella-associated protein 77 n=1 Tax=Cerrena zonata TaxID=2478898 RepID=A0AAW0GV87_9APHY
MPALKQETYSPEVTLQKQRYSQELAAYTFQQWDLARQVLERSRSQSSDKSSSRRSSSSPKGSAKSARSSPGIQSIDYARTSLKSTGAISPKGRAVDPSAA